MISPPVITAFVKQLAREAQQACAPGRKLSTSLVSSESLSACASSFTWYPDPK